MNCLDVAVNPECMYNDQTDFVGGDLPQVKILMMIWQRGDILDVMMIEVLVFIRFLFKVFGGGGFETDQKSSKECIEECEKRSGCK